MNALPTFLRSGLSSAVEGGLSPPVRIAITSSGANTGGRKQRTWIFVATISLLPAALLGQSVKTEPLFRDATFEELANITITTVSKREERLFTASAAVSVLTGDEAKKTGATTIAESLRVIPGLNVTQINSSTWGIGARGSVSQFASKLLVMIDGRSVYTPVFGGVFWDVQDYPLADLDRIEVVLGPGGSMWGANAVNGVINIITRSAQDTLGDRLSFSVGENSRQAELRHGWRIDPETAARVYAKFITDEGTRLATGASAQDGMNMARAGFRIDREKTSGASWTVSGEVYRGFNDLTVSLPTLLAPPTYQLTDTTGERVQGGNLLAHWEAPVGADGTLRLGASVDTDARHGAIFNFRTSKVQLDMQHSLKVGSVQALDWGVSARFSEAMLHNRWISFSRDHYRFSRWSGFVQDKITLQPDLLEFTAGIKLEHNDFTGLECQPSVKLAWFPTHNHTLWAGWSRAVRTPALTEDANITDVAVLPPGVRDPVLPVVIRGLGNPALIAETLDALDFGWRWAPHPQWSVSASVFFNSYHHLIKVTGAPRFVQATPVPALIIPLPEDNGLEAHSSGGEISLIWQPRSNWRINLGYTYMHIESRATTSDPFNFAGLLRNAPRATATASTTVQLAANWECTAVVRWFDQLPNNKIPRYTEASVNLAWRPNAHWELALVGRNLLHAQHPENRPTLAGPSTEIPRRIELRATWQR